MREKDYDVGVIVGRFQVPELHDAHKELIRAVCERHEKVIVFLGLSPLMVTKENPLDFESRKQMLLKDFPSLNVLYIKDQPSDEVWVEKLDEQINDMLTPAQSAVLYGGRDSFVKHYEPHGRFSTRELEADVYVSGSEVRKKVSRRSVKASPAFREGVVWAAYSQFPTVFTTVDIAVFDAQNKRILLGRKPNERLHRLPGGFATPDSESFEADAARELKEETNLVLDPEWTTYIGSFKVDDWRYRAETDKIKTLLFKTTYATGSPKAADDLAEVRWFELDALDIDRDVVDTHRPLVRAALNR